MHKDGRFTCADWVFLIRLTGRRPQQVTDCEYPLVLSTGRRLAHRRTRTQTGRCGGLNDILGEETADISPEDALSLSYPIKIHFL